MVLNTLTDECLYVSYAKSKNYSNGNKIHFKGRWLPLPQVRLVIENDLGAAASHIQSLSRLQVARHVIFYPSQSYFFGDWL